MKKNIILLLVFLPFISISQKKECNLEADSVKWRLYQIINVLSNDSLAGREAGSEEANKAAVFIKNKFEDIGLTNILENSDYLQTFEIIDGIKVADENILNINKKSYKLMEDFYPLNMSANATVSGEIIRVGYGVKSTENLYDDYEFYLNDSENKVLKGKIFAIEMGLPLSLKNVKNAADLEDIEFKVRLAIEKGAVAVIFINSNKEIERPKLDKTRFEQPLSIPVIYADQQAYKTIMDSNNSIADITIKIEKEIKNTCNVIGYLNNNAARTIVVGAHYDHLGRGNTLIKENDASTIYHGADDNASGVSAMIELARHLKCKNFTKLNVLFIAFGAEEKGVLGSNYFTKSNVYSIEKINYMLNFDMVGRIDSVDGKLNILGTGTSPLWDSIIDKIDFAFLKVSKSAHISGGSDHASFINKDIPALFFFSGLHDDYHKSGDVIEKINFNGIYNTIQYVSGLIDSSAKYQKLPFTKTNTESSSGKRNSSVSLGIMPDSAFDGVGLRVSDIIANKPAAIGGVIKGDIIIKIGENDVRDIYSYMNAMKKFKKGDELLLLIKRETKEISLKIIL